nr:hypothetical protein [uncultured Flavobacterium sp.]
MKRKILLLFFMSFFASNAQKVDLDHFYFDVAYQILPKEFVPLEKRTFSSNVKVGGAIQSVVNPSDINDKINLVGWKRVDQNPTVNVEINLEDFIEKGATTETRIEEQKDKDGKVLSRKVYYYVLSKYTTRGYAKIKGPVTPIPLTEKQIQEEKEKQASVATNRFLKNAVVKKDTTKTDGYNIRLSRDLEYKSAEYTESNKPLVDFYINKNTIRDKMLREYIESSKSTVNYELNYTYGFRQKSDKQNLWILDAKDDEGATQIDAIKAVRELFATMKADEPIDDLKANMQPLIEYFDSLKVKYKEDNKPCRKMRYSAYYNLAVIYLMLDQPEKTIIEAEKLIANDYDKSDGKGLIMQANQLIESFKISKLNTRHNPALK